MTEHHAATVAPEFSRILEVEELEEGETGTRHIDADAAEREALARRFDLVTLDRLNADIEFVRQGRIIALSGRVEADYEQTCVVTLEPVRTRLREAFAARFDPDLEADVADASELSPDEILDEEDALPLVGSAIDLGELVAETLGLAIEPYPRKEGSAIDPRYSERDEAGDVRNSPFEVLKKLKC